MKKSNIIPFVNLHSHTVCGSIFDGYGYPQQHIDIAIEKGMDALAITDHGNCNGLSYQVLYSKKLIDNGVNFKPIFGVETYFLPSIESWKKFKEEHQKTNKIKKKDDSYDMLPENAGSFKKDVKSKIKEKHHLILLAKNQIGLNNLFTIVSESYKGDYFYRYPRVDLRLLEKYNEGLIATSACVGGIYGSLMWKYRENGIDFVIEEMRKITNKMLNIFGDRWYGELQWNNIPEQHETNNLIIQLSKEYGFKIISTVDSHYPTKQDWKTREVYKRLGWLGKAGDKPDWAKEEIPTSLESLGYELFIKNGNEVWESFEKYGKKSHIEYDEDTILNSIKETYKVAHEEIESFLPDNTVRLPKFVVKEGKTANQQLVEMSIQGLKDFSLDKKKNYVERLKEELYVIKDRGFAQYFLTMKKIVDRTNETMLQGPGRGSSAGSLVAYVLGITQVDPIRHELLFSRFLRRDTTDYPDIDYDVSYPMELKDMLIKEWGENTVVPISNWNTLQLRSLIKDICKLYDIPWTEVNLVTSKMFFEATPQAKKDNNIVSGVYVPTFEELLKYSDSLNKFLNKYPEVKQHIEAIYGQIRSCSRHAGGVVIAEELNRYMPLINSGGVTQTPWTEGQRVRHLEPMGFIKFDILGLDCLKMIDETIRHILKRKYNVQNPTFKDVKDFYNKHLHPDVINFDDQKVYEEVFHKGRWVGTFQFTEQGAQDFCKSVKPKDINELSIITSIYRPSALAAGIDKKYIEAKENIENIKYVCKEFEEVTKETLGFIIYQEQIAQLAHKLGDNISLDDGNKLRKLLIKKGIGDKGSEKNKIYNKFIKGCIKKKLTQKQAEGLWRLMENFAGYGFCKCLHKNTLIETNSGTKRIKDIKAGDFVNSKNGFIKVKNVFHQRRKKLFKIKTENGKELICTMEHKLETKFGMKTLEDIIKNKYKIIVKN